MLWMKEPARLKAEMPQHLMRVLKRLITIKPSQKQYWLVYKTEDGKWRTILHDVMNVPVEAGKIDSYFTVHWLITIFLVSLLAMYVHMNHARPCEPLCLEVQ